MGGSQLCSRIRFNSIPTRQNRVTRPLPEPADTSTRHRAKVDCARDHLNGLTVYFALLFVMTRQCCDF